jgi:isocitrate dehydrogenase
VFAPVAAALSEQEQVIIDELAAVQGAVVDVGGYYMPDPALATAAMRPSKTFNEVLAILE